MQAPLAEEQRKRGKSMQTVKENSRVKVASMLITSVIGFEDHPLHHLVNCQKKKDGTFKQRATPCQGDVAQKPSRGQITVETQCFLSWVFCRQNVPESLSMGATFLTLTICVAQNKVWRCQQESFVFLQMP